ncbi:MAG TPA: hypothetical protein VN523_00600 [Hyphomicrobiaceae bacterium]|nr:hypothetical protein [Hyphomicrobiaceae bacterium]
MRKLIVRLNGIDLYLRAVGAADAPLILFLHGFSGIFGGLGGGLAAFADRFQAVAPDQRGAYMHELRHPQAEESLSANRYQRLLGMLSRFGPQPWLTPAKAAGYLAAWSTPGALTGMLNCYRATPLLVPKVGERVDLGALPKLDPDQLRVRMPHPLIWGMDDQALLPVSWATLPDDCDDLAVRKIAGADHWLVH